jgi:hypothetical protein
MVHLDYQRIHLRSREGHEQRQETTLVIQSSQPQFIFSFLSGKAKWTGFYDQSVKHLPTFPAEKEEHSAIVFNFASNQNRLFQRGS